MNRAASLSSPPRPDYRAAKERARAVLMEVIARAAGRLKSLYGATAVRIAAKRQAARASGLSVEGRVNLGPKKSLVLVHCHGRRYLVASAGDTMAPIVEVLPVASKKAPATRKRSSEAVQRKGRAQ